VHQFAKHTGQLWKFRVWQILTVGAVLSSVAFFSLWQGNPAHLPEGITTAVYFPVCVIWFIWWAAAIRCPACGAPPVWYRMNHGNAGSFQLRVAGSSLCPNCGFDPAVAKNGQQPEASPAA
jgi:hypothetical protein